MISGIKKGDSITLECNLEEAITDWKIRCEFWDDCGNKIQLATTNSGGSDDEVLITNAAEGKFQITIEEGLTTCFKKNSFIEIEVDTGETVGTKSEVLTIYQDDVLFDDERITWTQPE